LTAVLMGVALCFHSLLEGAAMGAQPTIRCGAAGARGSRGAGQSRQAGCLQPAVQCMQAAGEHCFVSRLAWLCLLEANASHNCRSPTPLRCCPCAPLCPCPDAATRFTSLLPLSATRAWQLTRWAAALLIQTSGGWLAAGWVSGVV
jgi:hypothetical protein